MGLKIIQKKIYEIRGYKVMLDKDLAELYQVSTKSLNLAVKRKVDRFPSDFMFQLTPKEVANLRFQFETSSWGGTRYFPYAFTELGVSMLSSVLNSVKAVQMNINIMRAFIALKQSVLDHKNLAEQIKEIQQTTRSHDEQLKQIHAAVETILEEKLQSKSWGRRKRIGFKIKKDKKNK
jgi:hypothetical protein